MKKMIGILFVAQFIFSVSLEAYEKTTMMCLESNQAAVGIIVDYYKPNKNNEIPYIFISKYSVDGSITTEKIEGFDPELFVQLTRTDDNEEVYLISSIIGTASGVNIRILVCHTR